MQKDELHKKSDLLLTYPSEKILKDFQKELIKIIEAMDSTGGTDAPRILYP